MATGVVPVAKGAPLEGVNVPSPFPSKIETVLSCWLTTAISVRSRGLLALSDPVTNAIGPLPVAGAAGVAVKVPSPLPSKMESEPGPHTRGDPVQLKFATDR